MDHFPGLRCALLFLWAVALPVMGQNVPERVAPPAQSATAQELEQQGDALRSQKDYLGSIDSYRTAWKKADSAILHNKAGISFFQLHRAGDARKQYEHSIRLDPAYAEPHNNLGALYYYAHRYGPAVREYQRAIKLSPDNATFHSNLGAAYFSEKDFSRAMKEFTRAAELDPGIFERQPSGGASVKLVTSGERGHLHYLMAQMYGTQNDLEHCRYYLAKANEEGYPIRDALHDGEFAGLRKDPNFVAFVRSLKPPGQENQ
jgi:tetratricopeptide (TPR) repeat protein